MFDRSQLAKSLKKQPVGVYFWQYGMYELIKTHSFRLLLWRKCTSRIVVKNFDRNCDIIKIDQMKEVWGYRLSAQ